jgi:S-formylglutathione hydrolase FrmB
MRHCRHTSLFHAPLGSVVLASLALTCAAARAQEQPHAAPASKPAVNPLRISVSYDPAIDSSFTGRVYVLFATQGEPRRGPAWVAPAPFFAVDVKDWKPDTPLIFDDSAISFPAPISSLEKKAWSIQAVMRRNPDVPEIGGEGNAYSTTIQHEIGGIADSDLVLRIDQVAQARPFHETDRIKLVEIVSPLLSRFYQREIKTRAAVVLPKGYDANADRRYPALYFIGGFGSNHAMAPFVAGGIDMSGGASDLCVVVPDPLCGMGHHVFADSANNGPRGESLITELIPEIERRFKLVAAPTGRFLTGASSGGWSSLWLQVRYPDFFGGVWSIAPDPVDFSNFQYIDLYRSGENMYRDAAGQRRPLMRMERGGQSEVLVWYEDFARMEVVLGEGGQLASFDAVFSPRGADGKPLPVFDRHTGAVNTAVAEAWKPYDISLMLKDDWDELGPKLAGKLRIFCGEDDNFYLEGAVKQIDATLDALGSDAVVEILPGKDHMNVLDLPMWKRMTAEVLETFHAAHPEQAPATMP